MSSVALNLVVLRSTDIARAAQFYSKIGIQFTRHQHGKGPEHYAVQLGEAVFELYPLAPSGGPSTLGTRIGFSVPSLDTVIEALREYPTAITSPPKDSEWGRRAVLTDPDGHRIELVQR